MKRKFRHNATITRLAAVSGSQLAGERAAEECPVRPSFCEQEARDEGERACNGLSLDN